MLERTRAESGHKVATNPKTPNVFPFLITGSHNQTLHLEEWGLHAELPPTRSPPAPKVLPHFSPFAPIRTALLNRPKFAHPYDAAPDLVLQEAPKAIPPT